MTKLRMRRAEPSNRQGRAVVVVVSMAAPAAYLAGLANDRTLAQGCLYDTMGTTLVRVALAPGRGRLGLAPGADQLGSHAAASEDEQTSMASRAATRAAFFRHSRIVSGGALAQARA